MVSQVAIEVSKKTNAKHRYLKRKKERRKNRRRLKPAVIGVRGSSEEDSEEDEKNILPDVDALKISEIQEERIRKRPRLSHAVTESAEIIELEDVLEENGGEPDAEIPLALALRALPSFRLPVLPDAPSKTVLAMQGLDENLIDAEIVHPSTVLPILTGEEDGGTRLSAKTRKRLRDLGITELFAVQTTLLPYLIPKDELASNPYLPFNPPRDVCISAPTGSGKTLAYVLPIIESLSSRVVIRLRALIVLPTRDLVTQVRETFEALNKGNGLRIGTATGQHSFVQEQAQLMNETSLSLQGGSSKVDILICTPGRLMDHLVGTPNFSLQHLRFLVIDEADRLLAQSFQDWLAQVLSATRPQRKVASNIDIPSRHQFSKLQDNLPQPDGLSPSSLHRSPSPNISTFLNEDKESSCQKLLFSATLTRDPGKIAALDLRDPKYFIVQGGDQFNVLNVVMDKFELPGSLKEHMIVSDSTKKPLMMFHLVYTYKITNGLVFTKSAESTFRLVRLLEFFEKARLGNYFEPDIQPIVVRAYSSDLPSGERRSILEDFKAQKVQLLICSDLISRGIDISHVSHVISYDAPVDMRKYVHRVGRTARAGREGDAWSLVEEQEARYFKQMLKEAGHLSSVKKLKVSEKATEPLTPFYEAALNQLKEVYTRRG